MYFYKKFGLVLAMLLCFSGSSVANEPTRYLAFQIFSGSFDSADLRQAFPPPPNDLQRAVIDLRESIGVTGNNNRKLGFILGPIAFDNSDDAVRKLIAEGFDIALETNLAVGFHIDDSMFWSRLKELNTPNNVEWLDWQGTLNTGRRLDWSEKPIKINPQLCINSVVVKEAVSQRAKLIGNEIGEGLKKLVAAKKTNLFIGVIAGWETQIGRDFDTGKYLGYCALTNAGYGVNNPPPDKDRALGKIIAEFSGLWALSLMEAGVPKGKVYSHIAYMSSVMHRVASFSNPDLAKTSYLQYINDTPPSVAFCDGCLPGVSTYPQAGHLEQWQEELKKHDNPPWASAEGTAIDPSEVAHAGQGMAMEGYLGNLFNHGAVLVNIFGWRVGDDGNAFRKIAENENALEAYRKFLNGEELHATPIPIPEIPPAELLENIHKVQAKLPEWIQQNGPAQVKQNIELLDAALKEKRYTDAAEAVAAILKTIGK